jgi:hypothetical protein
MIELVVLRSPWKNICGDINDAVLQTEVLRCFALLSRNGLGT